MRSWRRCRLRGMHLRRVELQHSTSGRQATTDGKVVEHDPGGLDVTSLRQRLWRVPAPVVDAGLAVALAVANTIGIRVALAPGARPDAVAYACGLTIAALALARRRWPLAVLLASSATLQIYVSNYASTYRAIPLSVALATAWAAGHRRWSLLVAAWYVIGPLAYHLSPLSEDTRTPLTLLSDGMSNAAMFDAVLVLGEAVRSRQSLDREHRLLLAKQER